MFDWDSWRSIYPYFRGFIIDNSTVKRLSRASETIMGDASQHLECPKWVTVASYVCDIFCYMMTPSNGNISALLAICAGNSPVTGEFPAQRPVTRSFGVFVDLPLNKRWSKQSWGWWFETLSHQLWRQCNEKLDDVSIFEEKVHCKLINIDTPSTNLQPRENYE